MHNFEDSKRIKLFFNNLNKLKNCTTFLKVIIFISHNLEKVAYLALARSITKSTESHPVYVILFNGSSFASSLYHPW